MKQALVTIKQAVELRSLGFHDCVSHYVMKFGDHNYDKKFITESSLTDWNSSYYNECRGGLYLSMPTVDEAIDWIRRKFTIIIYNATEPVMRNKTIKFGFAVKRCNKIWGYNQRVYICRGKWSKNHYAAKRMAISAAISWIKAQQKLKAKHNGRIQKSRK